MPRITALLTCFNRREKTLACLRKLHQQVLPDGWQLDVVMVDDGSTDGTSDAVAGEFPAVIIERGNGSLYWCGGMRVAWRKAAETDPDFYLLANDDTLLDPDALQTLLSIAPQAGSRVIAVASIRDPQTGHPTYGGIRGLNDMVPPGGDPETCDTFNGNAVLVPRAVYHELGMLHDAYTHGMGDYDYGLRATRKGIQVVQTPHTVGTCPRNPDTGTWRDRKLTRRRRWQLILSPKGLPFREWMTYHRRNSGWKWPWRAVTPYLRVLLGR